MQPWLLGYPSEAQSKRHLMTTIQLDVNDPLVKGPVHVKQFIGEIPRDAGDYLYFRWNKDDDTDPLWLFDRDGTAIQIESGRVRRVEEPAAPEGAWIIELNFHSTRPGIWTKVR